MSVVDSAKDGLSRKVGPLPLGGWGAIVVGVIVVVKLARGGGGGGGTVTVPDAFGGITDNVGGGGGSTITTPTSPIPGASTTPGTVKIQISGKTNVYDVLGKLLTTITGPLTVNATLVKVSGKEYYKFKGATGQWRLVPKAASTVKVVG